MRKIQIFEKFEGTPTRSRGTLPFIIYSKRFEVEISIFLCPDKMGIVGYISANSLKMISNSTPLVEPLRSYKQKTFK